MDALRADHLPCYGYYRNTAPNICALAKEGILFENAFAQASNTLPSHMSIFTSLYPLSHGVNAIFRDKLDDGILTFPQILKLYGYSTVWFGSLNSSYLDFEVGFGKGFDEKFRSVERVKSACNNTELFSWLERQEGGNKFFMFYHTYYVHAPYISRANYFGNNSRLDSSLYRFYNDKLGIIDKEVPYNNPGNLEYTLSALGISNEHIKRALSSDVFQGLNRSGNGYDALRVLILNPNIFWGIVNQSDKGELSYAKSLYDSAIVEADECLNEFFERLKTEGIYNNTIIIITADHGGEFMEHGNIDHRQLYDEVVHVPLIIKAPGIAGFRDGRLAESIDIMPTVLSLAGIEPPYHAQGIDLFGQSKKDFVYAGFGGKSLLRSKEWSLIINEDSKAELYNMPSDPKQKGNIAEKMPEIVSMMKLKLDSMLNSMPRYYKSPAEFSPMISNETKENIIKTGYW